jgi:hypothetical protein
LNKSTRKTYLNYYFGEFGRLSKIFLNRKIILIKMVNIFILIFVSKIGINLF